LFRESYFFNISSIIRLIRIDLKKGFIGVKDLSIDLIVDYSAEVMVDFVCGANQWDHHLSGCVWFNSWSPRSANAL
jgi:prolyl-tRNA synthetase